MLKRVLLLLLLLGGVALGQSLHPPHPPVQQHQPTAEQGTAAKAEQKHPPKSWRRSFWIIWEKTWDDPVIFYTFVLALFTGLLAVVSFVQGIFLLRADKTARISANAAALSAKAAVGQKLPILRCKTPHMWPSPNQSHADGFAGTGDPTTDNFIKVIELNFFNYGETVAYPREYGLGWLFTEKEPTEREPLPPEPTYSDVHSLNRELVIVDNFATPRNVTFCLAPDDNMKASLRSGDGALRLCAYIKYDDFIGTEHVARFCWRWLGGSRDGRYQSGLAVDDTAPESYTSKT